MPAGCWGNWRGTQRYEPNDRIKREIAEEMTQAEAEFNTTGKPPRVFKDFQYRTLKSWSCTRRVVAKAGFLDKGANPRFVVTSLPTKRLAAQAFYEDFYCARGDMENRITEQQLDLFADRTSAATMRAKSAPAVSILSRLHAHACTASSGAQGYPAGPRSMPDHPPEASQDRRSHPPDGPQRLDLDVRGLSLRRSLCDHPSQPAVDSSAVLTQDPDPRLQNRLVSLSDGELCLTTLSRPPSNPRNKPTHGQRHPDCPHPCLTGTQTLPTPTSSARKRASFTIGEICGLGSETKTRRAVGTAGRTRAGQVWHNLSGFTP